MTVAEEVGDYLQLVYITDLRDKVMLAINAEDKWSTELPKLFNKEAVENAVYRLCEQYGIDYIAEDTVSKSVTDAIKDYHARRTASEPDKPGLDIMQSGMSEAEKKGALVEELLQHFDIKTLQDTNEILYYERGVYRAGGKEKILSQLQAIGGYDITNHMRSEVIETIKSLTYVSRNDFDADLDIVNLKNGLFNVMTGKFSEHSPEHLSRFQLPIEYNPQARCPRIMKFLTSTLEIEHLGTIVRLLGYCIYRSTEFEKAVMFIGEGANGKSSLIKLIVSFLGRDNCSSVALQDLTGDRFAMADLYGKFVNCFADLKADRISNSGTFKMLVSGDRMRAQKKHQQPFEFENYAKLIFSANQIPQTSDDEGYAYYRRWVIVPFNRTFEGESRDETLIQKLTTEEELSGLFNVAVIGLRKLLEEHGFEDTDIEEIRRQYELGASKIRDFVQRDCILEPDNPNLLTSSKELQNAFTRYCTEHGSNYVDIRRLGEELKALGVQHKQKRQKKNREWQYVGIGLKCHSVTDKTLTSFAEGESDIDSKDGGIGGKEVGTSSETLRQPEEGTA